MLRSSSHQIRVLAGIFELVASLIIFIMGITMLKLDRAKAKWRVKLTRAFEGQRTRYCCVALRLSHLTFV